MSGSGQEVSLCVSITAGVATDFMDGSERLAAVKQVRNFSEKPAVFMMKQSVRCVDDVMYEEDGGEAVGE